MEHYKFAFRRPSGRLFYYYVWAPSEVNAQVEAQQLTALKGWKFERYIGTIPPRIPGNRKTLREHLAKLIPFVR